MKAERFAIPTHQTAYKTNPEIHTLHSMVCVIRYSSGATVAADASSSESTHRIPEFEGGEIENTPQVRDDVVREADSNIGEELPEIGTCRFGGLKQ